MHGRLCSDAPAQTSCSTSVVSEGRGMHAGGAGEHMYMCQCHAGEHVHVPIPRARKKEMHLMCWALLARKNYGNHIAASHSRQPLVKGERLVRYEVNAVMPK